MNLFEILIRARRRPATGRARCFGDVYQAEFQWDAAGRRGLLNGSLDRDRRARFAASRC